MRKEEGEKYGSSSSFYKKIQSKAEEAKDEV
jgi:hypothetical protein